MEASDHESSVTAAGAQAARTEYLARKVRWQAEREREERAGRWLSTGRIAAFTAGAALTWWVFASAPAAWPAPVAAFVAFA
ncbi:MAG: hypothetical protein ACYTG2_08050, partial [Planctomycetota bacterium]